MVEPRPDPQNFLDLKFVEFVIELARQKRLVRSGRWALQRLSAVSPAKEGEAGGPRKANPVWRSLEQLFRAQEREARSLGLETIYEKARYPMLALADQTFLEDIKWTGQADWEARCLELEFTRTAIAGSEFFRRANEILERGDPTDNEVCKVYFSSLKLGFHGQYQGGSQEIDDLQRALRLRFQSHGSMVRLSEQVYQHTERGGDRMLIPSIGKTIALVAAISVTVVIVFVVTNLINTRDLKILLDQIESGLGR